MKRIALVISALLLCAHCSKNASAPPTYTVGGTVTGLRGAGLTLAMGTELLSVQADGKFTFNTALKAGAAYAVSVAANPTCHAQTCTLGNASGNIAAANISDVTLSCVDQKTRLFSSNWSGSPSLRITDDFHSLADGATATPRIVTGVATTFANLGGVENLVYDRNADEIYVADTNASAGVKVFSSGSTTTGNVAPSRNFRPIGTVIYTKSLALDVKKNRLYITGNDNGTDMLWIYDNASTVNGVTAATVSINLAATPSGLFIDEAHDRLFQAMAGGTVNVYDSASTMTAMSTPARTITLTGLAAANLTSVWADACSGRLYLTDRNGSSGGYNVFGFDNAAALSGSVNVDSSSSLRIAYGSAMNVAVDGAGSLFYWTDSATAVKVVHDAAAQTGVIAAPDVSVSAVVNSGYGLTFQTY